MMEAEMACDLSIIWIRKLVVAVTGQLGVTDCASPPPKYMLLWPDLPNNFVCTPLSPQFTFLYLPL
jgi:hypothetical protein